MFVMRVSTTTILDCSVRCTKTRTGSGVPRLAPTCVIVQPPCILLASSVEPPCSHSLTAKRFRQGAEPSSRQELSTEVGAKCWGQGLLPRDLIEHIWHMAMLCPKGVRSCHPKSVGPRSVGECDRNPNSVGPTSVGEYKRFCIMLLHYCVCVFGSDHHPKSVGPISVGKCKISAGRRVGVYVHLATRPWSRR